MSLSIFDETTRAVLLALSPGLVLAALVVSAFGLFLVVAPSELQEQASRRHGTVIVPRVYVRFLYWLTDPVVRLLTALNIRPNHITAFSLLLAVAAGTAVALGHFMIGFWLFFAAITCDLVDGLAARHQDAQSTGGAFLDSWIDRGVEAAILGGIAVYGRDTVLLELSLWALAASFLVSYGRARGEALGVDCDRGLMQRPERMFVICWALFLSPLLALWLEPGVDAPIYHAAIVGIGLLAVLATITAVNRLRWIVAALDDGREAVTDDQ